MTKFHNSVVNTNIQSSSRVPWISEANASEFQETLEEIISLINHWLLSHFCTCSIRYYLFLHYCRFLIVVEYYIIGTIATSLNTYPDLLKMTRSSIYIFPIRSHDLTLYTVYDIFQIPLYRRLYNLPSSCFFILCNFINEAPLLSLLHILFVL